MYNSTFSTQDFNSLLLIRWYLAKMGASQFIMLRVDDQSSLCRNKPHLRLQITSDHANKIVNSNVCIKFIKINYSFGNM